MSRHRGRHFHRLCDDDSAAPWCSLAALIVAVAVESDPPDVIEFGGPEALSRNEAITMAERLTGRRMKRQHVPRWLLRLAMRLFARPYEALASALGLVLLRDLRDSYWTTHRCSSAASRRDRQVPSWRNEPEQSVLSRIARVFVTIPGDRGVSRSAPSRR